MWLHRAPRLELSALERAPATPADPHARGRRAPGSTGARAGGARALARAGRVRGVLMRSRARRAVGLLRGAADRQRTAWRPPRALERVTGTLPAPSDYARLPGRAQGLLGLPRAARRDRGRTGAGHQIEGRGRGVWDRALQRALPRIGVRIRAGVGPPDRADRLLVGPRGRVPHAG